jgi:hypothetical protein
MDVPQEMVDVLSSLGAEVLPLDGVNGIDIGLDSFGEFAIRLLVSDPDNPPAGLPDSHAGFSVILVAGTPVTEAVTPDGAKYAPVIGGVQLGLRRIIGGLATRGTLGCVFRDRSSGEPVAISNAHVLLGDIASGGYALGDVIQQPAPATDPPPISERIGTLLRWQFPNTSALFPSLGSGGMSGAWDGAVCSIDEGRGVSVGEIAEIGTVTGIGTARLGDTVRKRGYCTRLTFGKVSGLFGSYAVFDPNGNFLWWMLGQIAIDVIPDPDLNPDGIWSNSGDSGSVVVNEANEIIGLHHAGDATSGYACDFGPLAVALDINL